MKKKIEKETRIGDIVAKVNETLLTRFDDTRNLREEAHRILAGCAKTDKELWKDLLREHSLSDKLGYKLDHETGEVTAIRLEERDAL